jgi:hypothetical protein
MRAMNNFALRAYRYGDLDGLLTVEEASIEDSPCSRFDFIYDLGRARDVFKIAEEDKRLLGCVIAMGEGGVVSLGNETTLEKGAE